jgi:predicted nucleotidyltransferase
MNAEEEMAIAYLTSPGAAEEDESAVVLAEGRRDDDHWRWRQRFAERLAGELDAAELGVKGVWLFGSTKNATAGPASDIDLIIHFDGTPHQRRNLESWLEGWSLALSEMNYLRTGYRAPQGLLDVHILTNEDFARRDSFAVKIGAVTDPARKLLTKGAGDRPS